VGKSAVAGRLASRWRVAEVSDLARRERSARRVRGGWEVDLPRLRRRLRGSHALEGIDLVVGHLAHLLPVRAVVVLRCHPKLLARRLARARRGSASDRAANVLSEAIDVVLLEALDRKLPVYEVDTTGRRVDDVAREVKGYLRRGGRPRWGVVDWLADPEVTAHLLDEAG
jgi:adenylate kinase